MRGIDRGVELADIREMDLGEDLLEGRIFHPNDVRPGTNEPSMKLPSNTRKSVTAAPSAVPRSGSRRLRRQARSTRAARASRDRTRALRLDPNRPP